MLKLLQVAMISDMLIFLLYLCLVNWSIFLNSFASQLKEIISLSYHGNVSSFVIYCFVYTMVLYNLHYVIEMLIYIMVIVFALVQLFSDNDVDFYRVCC